MRIRSPRLVSILALALPVAAVSMGAAPAAAPAALTWKRVSTATAPPPRAGASMAYHAATRQVVRFGGFDGSGYRNDTWTFNGTTWAEQHHSAPSPRTRCRHRG